MEGVCGSVMKLLVVRIVRRLRPCHLMASTRMDRLSVKLDGYVGSASADGTQDYLST